MGTVIVMKRRRLKNAHEWNTISHIDAEGEKLLAAGVLRQALLDAHNGDGEAAAWLCSNDPWLQVLLTCVTPADVTGQDVQQRFMDVLEAA